MNNQNIRFVNIPLKEYNNIFLKVCKKLFGIEKLPDDIEKNDLDEFIIFHGIYENDFNKWEYLHYMWCDWLDK